jgi:hypothetical protein
VKWEWECGGRATIAMFWNVGSMLDARCFGDSGDGGPSRMAGHAMMMSYVSGGCPQESEIEYRC